MLELKSAREVLGGVERRALKPVDRGYGQWSCNEKPGHFLGDSTSGRAVKKL
jgi:hypothetical protein